MGKMQRKADNTGIAILRVSSARQKDNTSHEVQEREIRAYAEAQGIRIARVARFVESAKDSERRKAYGEAVAWALANDVRNLLFYMHDRESRNLTDNERNEKLVRAGLLTIHYVRDRKVIAQDSPDTDFFMRDIHAVTAKQYIRTLSIRVKDAARAKAESGWYPGNKLPLGYVHERLRDAEGRELKRGSVIVPDPNPKAIAQVRREYELRGVGGLSFQEIRRRIIAEGFIPAHRVKSYCISTLELRLKHPFYRGHFYYAGRNYTGKHEPILSAELVRAVDETFGLRGKGQPSRGIFGGGWLTCYGCGCHVVIDIKRKSLARSGEEKEYRYYHCTNGKGAHPNLKGLAVREDALWEQFGRALDRFTITELVASQIAKSLNATHDKVRAQRGRELADYRLALSALENREDELYRDLKSGLIDDGLYRRQIERLREDRRRYTTALEAESTALDDAYLQTAKSILELAKHAKSLWLSRSPEERREMLESVLSNRALDGLIVRYDLKKPFAILAEMNAEGDWRPKADEFRTAVLSLAA